MKNTVEKFNRLSSGSSSSSVTTANQSHSFVANRSRRRYGVSERSTNHCEPDDQNSEDTSFVSSNSHWKRRSRRTYGYTPPAWLGEKQRRSKGSDRRSTIASSVSNEPTEDICGKVVLLDLNDTPTMNRYNTRLSVGRNRTESNSSGRGLANAISLSNISVGPSPSSFESDTSRLVKNCSEVCSDNF